LTEDVMSRARTEYRYEKLTWPEINDAVDLGKVCIVPCGAVEQHGPHLPLDVDLVCPVGISTGAGKEIPEKMLVLPVVAYGYTGHDMPNLDLAARRTNVETDAECCVAAWWNLLTVDKTFLPKWRQSKFPGGCSHACELETSLYLYLDGDNVRKDLIKSGTISFNDDDSPFNWVDLFAAGPATTVSWTSSYSDTGVLGDAELATPEKGRQAYEEAVKQLVRFVTWFKDRPKDVRKDRHRKPPTMPIPWGQTPLQ
jgi:creatinine amidohydrolase